MRLNLAAIVMLMLPAVAGAQSTAPEPGSVPALPPLGLPLPQIGLPHPPTGLPAPAAPGTVRRPHADRQGRGSANRQTTRQGKPHRQGPYLVPVYGWPFLFDIPATTTSSTAPKDAAAGQPQRPIGRLHFDVAAGGDQQLFIDGYYVGTLGEFGSGVELEPGPHAVEIAAPEIETVRFSVNIAADQTITYRPTLKTTTAAGRASAPAATDPPPPMGTPTPMVGYIVPGCYIGNVPPQDAGLPASCDLSRTIIIKP